MGIIFSRFRKKKSAIETLEKLDSDIKEIEENRSNAQRKHKRITKFLLLFSVGLYVLCGIIFYFYFTSSLKGKLLYLVPLAISPLLLYIIKRIISWYFARVLQKNQIRLNEMKKEKKRILEEVMNKETYKVAKEILEKFSNEPTQKSSQIVAPVVLKPKEDVRKRIIPKPQLPNNLVRNYSGVQRPQINVSSPAPVRTGYPGPARQLPLPILPLNRSYVDKVVEYLIGDGPNNRYALICSQCHSHNGMALKEEFEYIGFKCCYCYFFNPARKVRPEAPKLESQILPRRESDSDSEKTSGEVSEAEQTASLIDNKSNLESLNDTETSTKKSDEEQADRSTPETKNDTETPLEESENNDSEEKPGNNEQSGESVENN